MWFMWWFCFFCMYMCVCICVYIGRIPKLGGCLSLYTQGTLNSSQETLTKYEDLRSTQKFHSLLLQMDLVFRGAEGSNYNLLLYYSPGVQLTKELKKHNGYSSIKILYFFSKVPLQDFFGKAHVLYFFHDPCHSVNSVHEAIEVWLIIKITDFNGKLYSVKNRRAQLSE